MADYLQHSSKGTSWKKKEHDYTKRQKKRYYYDYEAAQKKLWKLKQKVGESEEYKKAKEDYEKSKAEKKALRKSQANEDVASIYNDTARIMEAGGAKESARKIRKEAEYYQRKANDAKPRYSNGNSTKSKISDAYNRAKMVSHQKFVDVKKSTISKGKSLVDKVLKRK